MAKNEQVPVAVPAQSPAPAPAPIVSDLRVRFSPPAYGGKPDASGVIARPNVAEAHLMGCFGVLPLQLSGLILAKNGSQIVIYSPKTGPIQSAPPAIQRMRMPAPAGIESDAADGTVPVPGSALALERLHDAIRDAWAECNRGGATRWGTEYDLKLTASAAR